MRVCCGHARCAVSIAGVRGHDEGVLRARAVCVEMRVCCGHARCAVSTACVRGHDEGVL
jgi:hypothetical protein